MARHYLLWSARPSRRAGDRTAQSDWYLALALDVCTIIAKNYVAHARVLARSLARTHPGSRLSVLIIDGFERYLDPAEEPFEILTPETVGCEPFGQMAVRYSVLELSTAVKPWLLRHLLARGANPIMYLDPDIRIYGSLQPLCDAAAEHGVALIPHNASPIPADGRRPSQVDVMIAGIYNLGFVALAAGEATDRLLEWWSDRLLRDCRVDPVWGYFVDQRWFDLVPGFVDDLAIVRDSRFNLAYWNLHERRLEQGSDGYRVDSHPLSFFHFSGFDPAHPLVLSRHQDRIDVGADPVLEGLLAGYAAEVLAEGHATSRAWPYDFGALGDGTRLDPRLRELFDRYATEHGEAVPSPFTVEGVRAFDRWLSKPAPGAPDGLTRAHAAVYEERVDVRSAFPDLSGPGLAGYLEWAAERGRAEEAVLGRVVADADADTAPEAVAHPPVPDPFGPGEPLRGANWGINVVGAFRSEADMGVLARTLVGALDGAGIRAVPVLGTAGADGGRPFATMAPGEAPFSVTLACDDPAHLPEFVAAGGAELFAGRYTVALWLAQEAITHSARDALSLVEEVWAPSRHVAEALTGCSELPISQIVVAVDPPDLEARSRAELGLPEDRFVFASRFDHRHSFDRINPLGVVTAFVRAFEPGEGAHLRIDCGHAAHAPEVHRRLIEAAAVHPDIEIVDRGPAPAEIRAVAAVSDCYVSLHRDEAFGYSIAEAMWHATPVMATAYGGPLEFATPDNCRLVRCSPAEIPVGQEYLPGSRTWTDPDLDHAAALMRGLFEDRAGARAVGRAGAASIRESHSRHACAASVARRLELIHATGRSRHRAPLSAPLTPTLARLPSRVSAGPPPMGPRRGRAVRDSVRTAVLRVMQPFTAYQQALNQDLVMALGELNLRAAREQQAAHSTRDLDRSELLAVLRAEATSGGRSTGAASEADEVKRILTEQADRSLYLALAELRMRHAEITGAAIAPPPDRSLGGHELRAFSQNGEDGIIAEILRRIGVRSRFFIEFGVESGREGNCVYLADVAGWNGLFIESGDADFQALEQKYGAQSSIATVRSRVSADNVERLFAQADAPAEPDVLSIDVDGQDYWIWSALEAYRPRLLIIEYNSSLDPSAMLVQPDDPGSTWDGTDYYGASLGALEALGERKGYRLVHTDLSGVNAFFVRADLAGNAFPEPGTVARRGWPNYFQRGGHHPAAHPIGRYLDLASGALVPASRGRDL